jgi:hypothetical protein
MCTPSLLKVVETDTDLDPLRDDPRFQKLVSDTKKKLGFREETPPAIMPNPAA